MKIVLILIVSFLSSVAYAQREQAFAELLLRSVKEKNFELLTPYHDTRNTRLKAKWQLVVNNAHRKDFDINKVQLLPVVEGQSIPGLPMKAFIILYKYKDQNWDDFLVLLSTEQNFKFMEIPLDSQVFMLDEERRGKNLEDAGKKE